MTYSCLNCSFSCQTCYGPRYDQCLTCINPYSLMSGICILQCPTGFYRDSNSVCRQCDLQRCLTCQESASNCTSCAYPFVLVIYNSGVNGKCDVNCGFGSFYDLNNRICAPCSFGCMSCLDAMTCVSCIGGTYLYQDKCIMSCPVGFVGSSTDNICKKCPTNCN